MHEWIPVVCGMLLHWSRALPDARWWVMVRIVAVASLVMLAAGELRHARWALALDLLLVVTGMGAAAFMARARRRLRARPRLPRTTT